jgi:hypothetical protein
MGRIIKPLPSQSLLRELLDYSVITGNFYWRKNVNKRSLKGMLAGSFHTHIGYYIIRINEERYYSHRLAWKWVTGKDPAEVIDHINSDGSNNSWLNLREATWSQNSCNQKVGVPNLTGYKGVYYHRQNDCFTSQISVNRRTMHLGCFDTPEQAYAAYCAAADKYHGEFARYC